MGHFRLYIDSAHDLTESNETLVLKGKNPQIINVARKLLFFNKS